MAPEDLKALRKGLACTARELAGALGVEQETVLAWERGELFPTKRFVDAMDELRQKGPAAFPRQKKKPAAKPDAATPMAVLASPELWCLVRKLVAHAELRAAAMKLADGYADPAEDARG